MAVSNLHTHLKIFSLHWPTGGSSDRPSFAKDLLFLYATVAPHEFLLNVGLEMTRERPRLDGQGTVVVLRRASQRTLCKAVTVDA